jgi:hypothetical protein
MHPDTQRADWCESTLSEAYGLHASIVRGKRERFFTSRIVLGILQDF